MSERVETDEELVAAMARGRQEALGRLYERYSDRVYAVAQAVLRDPGLASDLTQEVFLESWRKSASFERGRGTVWAWLSVRTRTRALDTIRKHSRRREQALGEELAGAPARSPSMDVMHLADALDTISDDERDVLQLGYFEDLSSAEIAERLEIPVGTVKSRVRAGLRKLKGYMGGAE